MDSGSTGSMQSSSGGGGGEDEYDSRAAAAESIPPFLISNPSAHFLQISNPLPPPPFFFDPAPSNYVHTFNSTPTSSHSLNSLLAHHNQESLWSRSSLPRTDYPNPNPNPTELGHRVVSSSSPSVNSLSLLGASFSNASTAPLPPPLLRDGGHSNIDAVRTSLSAAAAAPPSDQINPIPPRGSSKKRTRASRRAPTTVLTTDTSNFRAMVQEFTGIPAPPFSSGASPSLYSSRRLDLFSTAGSAMRSTAHSSSDSLQLPPLGPAYPLRPSAQKANQPSPPPSLILKPPSSAGFVDSANNNNASGSTNATSSVMNYQNLLINMRNDSPAIPKFGSLFADNAPFFSPKAHQEMSEEQLEAVRTAGLNMSGFPVHESSSDRSLQLRRINPINSNSSNTNNNIDLFTRSFNFNEISGSCKLNSSSSTCPASSTFPVFQPEKGPPEIVISRPEGTVDSWICNPSD